MQTDWLNDLKVGDTVLVCKRYGTTPTKVDRITATQIILGELRFKKSTGKLITSDQWSTIHIQQATPERTQALADEAKRAKLLAEVTRAVEGFKLKQAPTEQLQAILDAFTNPQSYQKLTDDLNRDLFG